MIVCAHGYSGNARDFDYLAARLAQHARVLCIDFPGRGDSQWLTSTMEYHFGQFVADVRTLLAQLRVTQVDWIGTSMGGLVGMLLASQPSGVVRRLVMNDVGAYLPMDALRSIGRHLEAPASFASLAQVESHLRRTRAEWGPIADEDWKAMARHQSRPLQANSPRLRLHFDPRIARLVRPLPFTPGLSFWDAWYRVRCPALLLRGATSSVFPQDIADTMLDIKPDTRLVELKGCGHAPSLMTPEHAALVRDFLQDGGVETKRRADGHAPPNPLPARAA